MAITLNGELCARIHKCYCFDPFALSLSLFVSRWIFSRVSCELWCLSICTHYTVLQVVHTINYSKVSIICFVIRSVQAFYLFHVSHQSIVQFMNRTQTNDSKHEYNFVCPFWAHSKHIFFILN